MPNIYDVARESGVSVGTVSNVLNNGPRRVKPETQQRILAVMSRLDYHPSAMARSLVRGRTNTLGIMFSLVESSAIVINAYSSAILQGVLTAAAETGFNVMHLTQPWRDAEHSAHIFRNRRTDGILVIAPTLDSDLIPTLAALDLPVVAVSWPSERYDIPSVDVDDVKSARLATEHLLGLGHTRVAHLMGHANLVSVATRRATFVAVLAEAGVPANPQYIVPGLYYASSGYENTQRLLALPEPPTAIFAGNDEIAFGALEAARELGVSVPEQLSLIGVDDRPMASLVTPALTTVRQPLTQIGETAARMLVQRVEGKPVAPTVHLLEPELAVRGSTAPPAS